MLACRYVFETASIERLRRLYDLSEAEAEEAIAAELPTVAHDYVLKCSHVFNILDARGAIGVTERAAYFGRMRRLSRLVAERYLARRSLAGHSLLDPDRPWLAGAGLRQAPPSAETLAPAGEDLPREPAGFVLEVGTEELPVGELATALDTLAQRVPALLDELRLTRRSVEVCGTPRRLVILIESLAARQADQVEEVVGPPAAVAFGPDGRPTAAGEGFARSMGVSPGELRTVQRGGQERVAATRRVVGRPAGELLAEALPALLASLSFQRSMRWNGSGQSFARPVRWLLALHGPAVVGVRFGGLVAGRTSWGLRAADQGPIVVASAEEYRSVMASAGIELDVERRRALILQQAGQRAATVGGRLGEDAELLDEVTHLVECPRAISGGFDPAYLELPQPVLTTVLKKHQRCFPVFGADGALRPHFVAVANGRELAEEVVRHGNESVVAARFADAAYFWRRDISRPLADFTPALARLTFHSELGSMLDKTARLEQLVAKLAPRLGLSATEQATAARAATLAKSDLATEMVVEFTSLQGVMGREYARRSGESESVAQAIYEQYLPRGAGDELPRTPAGIALALADRLDSLTGLFAVGIRPSGAADPYGLRRAALGVVTILAEARLRCDLAAALDDAAAVLPVALAAEVRSELVAFLRRRLEGYLRDAGYPADVVAAVLAIQGTDPARAAELTGVLAQHVQRPDWLETLHAYARCLRIVRPVSGPLPPVDPALFQVPAEQVMLAALEGATGDLDLDDAGAVLDVLALLAPTINRYFDDVLVMAEDERLRANRLTLVRRIADLPRRVADLSLLEGF